MASEEKSVFEELAPFARMVVVPGVTVGNLVYSNQQDLYSSAAFASSATGIVAANTQLQFFVGALNESAIQQGYTAGTLSLGQTNSRFSKGQAPANQVYIATHAAFQMSKLSALELTANPVESLLLAAASAQAAVVAPPLSKAGVQSNCDVFALGQSFSWDLTVGRGITRTIGTLNEYATAGVSATQDDGTAAAGAFIFAQNGSPCASMRRLEVPIVFPPLVNVNITASNGSPVQLVINNAITNVQMKMILKGYLMTMPVG